MAGLTVSDIEVGKTYRGNSRRRKRVWNGAWDDRTVIWMNHDRSRVQYDGLGVPMGRHYPTVDMDKFLRWVGKEVGYGEEDKG